MDRITRLLLPAATFLLVAACGEADKESNEVVESLKEPLEAAEALEQTAIERTQGIDQAIEQAEGEDTEE